MKYIYLLSLIILIGCDCIEGPGGHVLKPNETTPGPIPSPLTNESAATYACKYHAITNQPENGALNCFSVKVRSYEAGYLVKCYCGGYENSCSGLHADMSYEPCMFISNSEVTRKDGLC